MTICITIPDFIVYILLFLIVVWTFAFLFALLFK